MKRILTLIIPVVLFAACTVGTKDPVLRNIEKYMKEQAGAPEVKAFVGLERIDSVTFGRNIDRTVRAYRAMGKPGKLRTGKGDGLETREGAATKVDPVQMDVVIKRLKELRTDLGDRVDEVAAYTYAYKFENDQWSVETYFVQMTPSNEVITGAMSRKMLEYAPGGFPGDEEFDLPELPFRDRAR